MIRLVLVDVDGTLIGRDGVHPSTWPAIAEARAAGVRVALATGRIGVGVASELARRVDGDGLHVFHGGAVVTAIDREPAHVVELPANVIEPLVAEGRRTDVPLELYTVDQLFVERENELTGIHTSHLGLEPVVGDLLDVARPVVRALWPVPEHEWPRFRAFTEGIAGVELGPATAPWAPGAVFGNITARGASKAGAIRWLASRYDLPLEAVAMVGDGENDLEAFAVAGLAIAVASAPARVREQADLVVDSPDEGGVAEALRLAATA